MFGLLRRLVVGLPLVALVFLPDTASAGLGPTIITGPNMTVTISATGTRSRLSAEVPITVRCNLPPAPFNGFGGSGGGQMGLKQANPARTAVAAANWGWINGPGTISGDLGGGIFFQPISCDGTTVNSYTVLITPDLVTDPFTVALHGGPTDGTFAAEICNFVNYNTTCASASGPFSVILTR
jgi:hypothetical protein